MIQIHRKYQKHKLSQIFANKKLSRNKVIVVTMLIIVIYNSLIYTVPLRILIKKLLQGCFSGSFKGGRKTFDDVLNPFGEQTTSAHEKVDLLLLQLCYGVLWCHWSADDGNYWGLFKKNMYKYLRFYIYKLRYVLK